LHFEIEILLNLIIIIDWHKLHIIYHPLFWIFENTFALLMYKNLNFVEGASHIMLYIKIMQNCKLKY